ncbi:hypothetical protein ElyMa_003098900 [Elysia marginata]|uniref:Uncharacterized protein n=1 Tax=Elysia marginata TaxID=1093978 RepID=A0AAV4IQA1_9GAST|nr:hypothetical protein ElyMa_003098900 [Elysia marginata]
MRDFKEVVKKLTIKTLQTSRFVWRRGLVVNARLSDQDVRGSSPAFGRYLDLKVVVVVVVVVVATAAAAVVVVVVVEVVVVVVVVGGGGGGGGGVAAAAAAIVV